MRHLRFILLAIILSFFLAYMAHADATDGEKMLTPNQQRRIVQVNQDLPKDIVDQPRDSSRVAELRKHLREDCANYRQIVKNYGSGTPEAHTAAHQVMDTQEALHKQFVKEEAIPALSQLPQ